MAGSWKKFRGALKLENARGVIFNPENSMPLMVALFVMEIFINVWVIRNIRCKLGVVLNFLSFIEYNCVAIIFYLVVRIVRLTFTIRPHLETSIFASYYREQTMLLIYISVSYTHLTLPTILRV